MTGLQARPVAMDATDEWRGQSLSRPGGTRIMVVDDDPDVRDMIADVIVAADPGTTVIGAETGDQAVSELTRGGADCVILDYRLGIEDGLEVLPRLKAVSRFVPVIMLTGQGNEEVAAKAMLAGASDYLVKQNRNMARLLTTIERSISRARLEAKIADQSAERAQLLRIIVHDLRAPLRQLRVLQSLFAEQWESGDVAQAHDLLRTQAIIADHAATLITDLEDYALLENEVELRTVALGPLVGAACENMRTYLEENGAEVVIADLPEVTGNAPQLIRVFQNLISNAVKYNHSKNRRVEIAQQSDSTDRITITVRDNGIGIPEESHEEIFDPLKRLWGTTEYEGTGLGLSICRTTLARHGGKIWCRSRVDEGSTFYLEFPVS